MNIIILPEIASRYDQFYLSERGNQINALEKNLIESLIKDIKSCTMLEAGCGTGHWSEFFSNKGFIVVGVDSSKAMLDIAIKKKIYQTVRLLKQMLITYLLMMKNLILLLQLHFWNL